MGAFCCLGSQVRPVSERPNGSRIPPGDNVFKEVRRQKIVLARANKLPRCFRTMVLQEFPGWNPLPTITVAVLYFLIGACAFIVFGALATSASLSVNEIRVRYDNVGDENPGSDPYPFIDAAGGEELLGKYDGEGYFLNLTFNISHRMEAPVYFFHYIKGFYGGHRRYIRSRSNPQLAGVSDLEATDPKCRPQLYNTANDKPNPNLKSANGLINPCGLLAWSFFNDTFSLHDITGEGSEQIQIDDSDLAWSVDRKALFSDRDTMNFNTYSERGLRGGGNITTVLNEAEHFMLWMRPTATPDLYHLWGRIDRDLEEGTELRLRVHNRYNSYGWEGEKGVVLTTNSPMMGGRNIFVGVYCIFLGGAYLLACIIMLLSYLYRNRKGELATQELSWQQQLTCSETR